MSQQNRKHRIRSRMDATGEKYTHAARQLARFDALIDAQVQPGPIVKQFRSNCNNCGGGAIRWVEMAEFRSVSPEMIPGLLEVYSPEALAGGQAWICPNCDERGVFLDEGFVGESPFGGGPFSDNSLEDIRSECMDCGAKLSWIDPAEGARTDRAAYLNAKKQWGPAPVLAGAAGRCQGCGHIEFHPDMSVAGHRTAMP